MNHKISFDVSNNVKILLEFHFSYTYSALWTNHFAFRGPSRKLMSRFVSILNCFSISGSPTELQPVFESINFICSYSSCSGLRCNRPNRSIHIFNKFLSFFPDPFLRSPFRIKIQLTLRYSIFVFERCENPKSMFVKASSDTR